MATGSELRKKIEAAWKTKAYRSWMLFTKVTEFGFSENTIAYGTQWQITIHHSTCDNPNKHLYNCICVARAADLVDARVKNIERGMPDLHPDVESYIWDIAFKLHNTKHGSRSVITPSWADSPGEKCDCFEIAEQEYNRSKITESTESTEEATLSQEDVWYYEQRIE
jgi:hypothetical protein